MFDFIGNLYAYEVEELPEMVVLHGEHISILVDKETFDLKVDMDIEEESLVQHIEDLLKEDHNWHWILEVVKNNLGVENVEEVEMEDLEENIELIRVLSPRTRLGGS